MINVTELGHVVDIIDMVTKCPVYMQNG